MDRHIEAQLMERNRRIIAAVQTKAERVCPGAIDLIAVSGSFCTGDYYEKSDLDLLIVLNDPSGWKIAKCFIVDDVGHDIYCHTWAQLEKMAGYPDPHVIKLIQTDVVFCANMQVRQRYEQLCAKLQSALNAPLCESDLKKIRGHYNNALNFFGQLFLTEAADRCKYVAAAMLWKLEYAVYMLNKAYIRHGIRGIPCEICGLDRLPAGFVSDYHGLIRAADTELIRSYATRLMQSTDRLITESEQAVDQRKPLSAQTLRGSYEEIYSNWKNKMERAAKEGDAYLSWMTNASCQRFYEEMASNYMMEPIDLFQNFRVQDPDDAVQRFCTAMEEYRKAYDRTGISVCHYVGLDAFEADYLNDKETENE